MDIVVDKLEALVKQAEKSLDNTLFDIEMQYSKQFGFQFKPAEIIHSTQELTQEFEELKKEADMLVTKQEEVRNKIDKELNTVCKKIMDLQKRVGSDPGVESVARTILKTRNVNSQE